MDKERKARLFFEAIRSELHCGDNVMIWDPNLQNLIPTSLYLVNTKYTINLTYFSYLFHIMEESKHDLLPLSIGFLPPALHKTRHPMSCTTTTPLFHAPPNPLPVTRAD